MIGYIANIEAQAEANTDFRRVLYTGSKLQLVLMAVEPGEELGGEVHDDTDQFFRVEEGNGRIVIDGVTRKVKPGDGIVVPAGAYHNLICTGQHALKVYTIYGPPHHRDHLVQKTRTEAGESEASFEGQATEQGPATLQM